MPCVNKTVGKFARLRTHLYLMVLLVGGDGGGGRELVHHVVQGQVGELVGGGPEAHLTGQAGVVELGEGVGVVVWRENIESWRLCIG